MPTEKQHPQPYAKVQPRGRWTYYIRIYDHEFVAKQAVVIGRRWATSKARRTLRKYPASKARKHSEYLAWKARQENVRVITLDEIS